MFTAEYFIDKLQMEPHVEGGYCREFFKSPRQDGDRPLASSIYYLLKSGQTSKFHRLKSAELWFYHYGSPLLIHQIVPAGELVTERLGLRLDLCELPQIIIPAGRIFGAEVVDIDSFCLVSCVVTPGFDYRDFEIFSRAEMLAGFPQYQAVIDRLHHTF